MVGTKRAIIKSSRVVFNFNLDTKRRALRFSRPLVRIGVMAGVIMWGGLDVQADSRTPFSWLHAATTEDAVAYSDTFKPNVGVMVQVNDSVYATQAAIDAGLTKLAFDWKIDLNHQNASTVPFGIQSSWIYTNVWSYNILTDARYDADFSITLTPTDPIGTAPFTRTAPASTFYRPLILGLNKFFAYAQAGEDMEIGGELRYLAASASQMPSSAGSDDELNTPLDDVQDLRLVQVRSLMERYGPDQDQVLYRYIIKNHSGSSVSGSWTLEDSSGIQPFSFTLGPEAFVELSPIVSGLDPAQFRGLVNFNLGGQSYSFFAPGWAPVPEPTAATLLMAGALSVIPRRLRRKVKNITPQFRDGVP